jgi:hypothetical protein
MSRSQPKQGDGFGHEAAFEGETNDWITPKWVIDAFDSLSDGQFFALDPCASVTQPWPTARKAYTVEDNGLVQPWDGGHVWCNPPYGPHTSKWVRRLAEYGDGIALIFARVETQLWQNHIFPTASGFLFPRRRIAFARPDGTTPNSSSGAPSAFIAWGVDCRAALIELCDSGGLPGAFLDMAFYTGSFDNPHQATLFQMEKTQ